jgi:hypothetical protein
MKNLILIIALLLVTGCASTQRKFSWTDKASRLMVDPAGIPAEHYSMIQDALIRSDRFVVIDRPAELDTLIREAEATNPDLRKTRWKDWEKKYDIGGVVVAHVQCQKKYKGDQTYADNLCHQFLAIMDSSTGKEVAVVEGENSAPAAVSYEYLVPDWEEIAGKLAKQFDKHQAQLAEKRELASESKPVELPKLEAPKVELPKAELPKVELPIKSEAKPAESVAEAPKPMQQPVAEQTKPEEPKAQEPVKEQPKQAEAAKQEPKKDLPEQANDKASESSGKPKADNVAKNDHNKN